MSRIGTNLAQETKVITIQPPIDIDTASGASSDVFSMAGYSHASIIISTGVTNATAGTITVEECDDFVPTASAAIAFDYYSETTANGDTYGAKQTATASGFALSGNDNGTYIIELDASQLSEGFPCVQVEWSNPGGSTLGSIVVVLSGPRYARDQAATAIA